MVNTAISLSNATMTRNSLPSIVFPLIAYFHVWNSLLFDVDLTVSIKFLISCDHKAYPEKDFFISNCNAWKLRRGKSMSTVNAFSSSSSPSSSSTHITSSFIDVFYPPPQESLICEMAPVETYSASPTIKTLVKILKEERGPVAVIGELALAYLSKPKFNHKVNDVEIYGWAPGSPRRSGKEALSYAFVLTCSP
jgi:hypothetical protein